VQCDFNLPERFDLKYVASSGEKLQPIMLHRAIFGGRPLEPLPPHPNLSQP
jgi:threonyl-tRNA synthetase